MPTSRNNWSTMWRIIWNVWSPCLWTYKEMFLCFEKLMQSIKVSCSHLFLTLVMVAWMKLANISSSLTGCSEMVEQPRALCSHFAKTDYPLFRCTQINRNVAQNTDEPTVKTSPATPSVSICRILFVLFVYHQPQWGEKRKCNILSLGKRIRTLWPDKCSVVNTLGPVANSALIELKM